MKKLFLITLLAAALTAAQVYSEEEEPNATDEIEEVEVESQKLSESQEAHPTGSVAVIDASHSMDRVVEVGEALEQSAGVTVKRYGGLGGYSTVMIRGASSSQVAVFLDGVPLSGASVGSVNIANLPLDALDRIEVYRGVAPIGFGGAAIGGAVNLVTRSSEVGWSAGAAASYGSFNTYKLDLFASSSQEDRNILFFYNHLGSDGNFDYRDDNGTPFNKDDDTIVERNNNYFTSDDILLKTGYKITDRFEVFALNEFYKKIAGVPGLSTLRIGRASYETMRNTAYLGGRYRTSSAEIQTLGYFTYNEENYRDPDGEIGVGIQDNLYVTRSYGANALGKYYFGKRAMTGIFVEGKRETYREFDLLTDAAWPENTRNTFSGAAQSEIYFFESKLILVPTIRVENYKSEFSGASSATYSFAGEKTTESDTLYSPHFGVRVNPWKPFYLTANVGKYYRVPSFVELFGDRGTTVGNPDLEPESGIHADAGTGLKYNDLGWVDQVAIAYGIYYLDVRDIVIFVQNSQRTARAENVSRAEILGHELSCDLSMLDSIRLNAVYTFQDTRDRSGISYLDGNPLPGRPVNELHATAALYRKNVGEIFSTFDYIDGNYLDRAGYIKASARRIYGAGITLTPIYGLSLTFEAKNLGDDQVSDILGYPLPGRSYYGTIRYSYDQENKNAKD